MERRKDGRERKNSEMLMTDCTGKCAYCGKVIEIEEPKEFWRNYYPLPICCSKECSDAYFDKDYQKKLRRL